MSEPIRLSDTSMVSVKIPQQATNQSSSIRQGSYDSNVYEPSKDIGNDGLEQVDSEDVPAIDDSFANNGENTIGSTTPFYKQLLQRMNPNECISPTIATVAHSSASAVQGCTTSMYKTCVATDREELEFVLRDILHDIRKGGSNKSTSRSIALQKLYRLTDREHAHNRVPAVCTTSFATIEALVTCLHSSVPVNDRRQSLLVINNLCIPIENKAAIIFGEPFELLMNSILQLVQTRSTESYLALVALLNLSYIQDDHAKAVMFNYVLKAPNASSTMEGRNNYGFQLPIDNMLSSTRILESMIQDYIPYVDRQRGVNSIELQCCRWSMNVIRNLIATSPTHSTAIAQRTKIPFLAIQFLTKSDPTNLATWTRDSLEDASLMVLIHICRFDECVNVLKSNSAAVDQLIAFCKEMKNMRIGIHPLRASALLDRLQTPLQVEEDNVHRDCSQSVGYSV